MRRDGSLKNQDANGLQEGTETRREGTSAEKKKTRSVRMVLRITKEARGLQEQGREESGENESLVDTPATRLPFSTSATSERACRSIRRVFKRARWGSEERVRCRRKCLGFGFRESRRESRDGYGCGETSLGAAWTARERSRILVLKSAQVNAAQPQFGSELIGRQTQHNSTDRRSGCNSFRGVLMLFRQRLKPSENSEVGFCSSLHPSSSVVVKVKSNTPSPDVQRLGPAEFTIERRRYVVHSGGSRVTREESGKKLGRKRGEYQGAQLGSDKRKSGVLKYAKLDPTPRSRKGYGCGDKSLGVRVDKKRMVQEKVGRKRVEAAQP
ncbi:hypothetical protein C8R45DRAFT_946994 [Mycena sanguinolenta]|nr:hypothetical protein C8R45DRAFT_946994 [Mycena sanguinolenta]